MARLTKRRIEAIRTALGFYLAGEPSKIPTSPK